MPKKSTTQKLPIKIKKATTALEKKLLQSVEDQIYTSRREKDTQKSKKKKHKPSTVLVDLSSAQIIPLYKGSKYSPIAKEWVDEYLFECLDSLSERERFLKGIQVILDDKGNPINGTFEEQREDLGKERYIPLIKFASIAGFTTWVYRHKRINISKDIVSDWGSNVDDFKAHYRKLVETQEEMALMMGANKIADTQYIKMVLRNHGYKEDQEVNVNISAKGLFDEVYAASHRVKTPEYIEAEVINADVMHAPYDEEE